MTAETPDRKLVASPNFALCLGADGRAFVSGEVEPYPQYWLSDRERMLFAMFGRKGGARVAEVTVALAQLLKPDDVAGEVRRIAKAISGMCEAGVLIAPAGELSRYGKAMARDYLIHRPFPKRLADRMATLAQLPSDGYVLDLASGPGSLALEMAGRGANVTIMELSRGFVSEAKAEAKRRGVALNAINESCNRLTQHDGRYDLITVSQALHWLDDVAVCKGVCRTLSDKGSFMVIHAAINVPDAHPLSYVLGNRTPLGDKSPLPFDQQVEPLFKRIALLFEALDAPQVERHDPSHARMGSGCVAGAGIELFNQRRPIDEGFARAFLSERHIASMGATPDEFWPDLQARCAGKSPKDLAGSLDWAVLHFRRGAKGFDLSGWKRTSKKIAYP